METPNFECGLVFNKIFRKISFELMASSLRRYADIFEKGRQFSDDVTGRSNIVHRFVS